MNVKKPSFLQQPNEEDDEGSSTVRKLNYQPGKGDRDNRNRYVLKFQRETEDELKERKEAAYQSLTYVSEQELEIEGDVYFPKQLQFPKRPPWSFEMGRDTLEAKENKYFTVSRSNQNNIFKLLKQYFVLKAYLNCLEVEFGWKNLSFFELNIETWRQLWRVLEMSDIVLVIVDIRFPVSSAFYDCLVLYIIFLFVF